MIALICTAEQSDLHILIARFMLPLHKHVIRIIHERLILQ